MHYVGVSKGQGGWTTSVVGLGEGVEGAVEEKASRLVKPGPVPVREAIMVPWELGSAGKPPNVEAVTEVGATLGTVCGAEAPAEGFRRLVSRQRAGALIVGGSGAGTGRVQHRTECTLLE